MHGLGCGLISERVVVLIEDREALGTLQLTAVVLGSRARRPHPAARSHPSDRGRTTPAPRSGTRSRRTWPGAGPRDQHPGDEDHQGQVPAVPDPREDQIEPAEDITVTTATRRRSPARRGFRPTTCARPASVTGNTTGSETDQHREGTGCGRSPGHTDHETAGSETIGIGIAIRARELPHRRSRADDRSHSTESGGRSLAPRSGGDHCTDGRGDDHL